MGVFLILLELDTLLTYFIPRFLIPIYFLFTLSSQWPSGLICSEYLFLISCSLFDLTAHLESGWLVSVFLFYFFLSIFGRLHFFNP